MNVEMVWSKRGSPAQCEAEIASTSASIRAADAPPGAQTLAGGRAFFNHGVIAS